MVKEGARHHGTGARGYHPLLAIAAGTGEVLSPGEGRANPGAAHFLRLVRYGGARGLAGRQGFYDRSPKLPYPARQPAGDRGRRWTAPPFAETTSQAGRRAGGSLSGG